jgi:hypothetical protein
VSFSGFQDAQSALWASQYLRGSHEEVEACAVQDGYDVSDEIEKGIQLWGLYPVAQHHGTEAWC